MSNQVYANSTQKYYAQTGIIRCSLTNEQDIPANSDIQIMLDRLVLNQNAIIDLTGSKINFLSAGVYSISASVITLPKQLANIGPMGYGLQFKLQSTLNPITNNLIPASVDLFQSSDALNEFKRVALCYTGFFNSSDTLTIIYNNQYSAVTTIFPDGTDIYVCKIY